MKCIMQCQELKLNDPQRLGQTEASCAYDEHNLKIMREVIECKDAVKIWGPETFCSGVVVIFRRGGSTYLRP